MILGTPVYHGSYSGVLKNTLDYCGFDEFDGRPWGSWRSLAVAFPSPHSNTFARSVGRDCRVSDIRLSAERAQPIADGQIVDADIEERVVTLGEEAVQFAPRADPACFEVRSTSERMIAGGRLCVSEL